MSGIDCLVHSWFFFVLECGILLRNCVHLRRLHLRLRFSALDPSFRGDDGDRHVGVPHHVLRYGAKESPLDASHSSCAQHDAMCSLLIANLDDALSWVLHGFSTNLVLQLEI